MRESQYTRRIHVDRGAHSRLLRVADEADIYDGRHEANQDCYKQVINLLCDEFDSGDST